jgi:7-carboxy-7-deazaguanine synthase
MDVEAIVDKVQVLGIPMVLLTGGEPMLQPELPILAARLLENKFQVFIETSGAHALDSLPEEVIRIVDVKTPYSGEAGRTQSAVLRSLKKKDAIKFVLGDEADYQWAIQKLPDCIFPYGPEILFSPVHGQLDPKALVSWILRDRLSVRVNLQLHKYIWGADISGV